MARGWESKSVEEQIELAESSSAIPGAVHLTPEQHQRQRARDGLDLCRRRILHDLASATHPRHREMLEAALAHIDKKIAELG